MSENPMDHLAEVMRRIGDLPDLPEVRVGNAARVLAYLRQAGIEMRERETPGPDSIFGIPIRVDPSLPPDVMRIGDLIVRLPDPETGEAGWMVDLSGAKAFVMQSVRDQVAHFADSPLSEPHEVRPIRQFVAPSVDPSFEDFMRGWSGLT